MRDAGDAETLGGCSPFPQRWEEVNCATDIAVHGVVSAVVLLVVDLVVPVGTKFGAVIVPVRLEL